MLQLFQHFSDEKILDTHKEIFLKTSAFHLKTIPKEVSHVKFEDSQKTLMYFFVIYADIDAILKESDDN